MEKKLKIAKEKFRYERSPRLKRIWEDVKGLKKNMDVVKEEMTSWKIIENSLIALEEKLDRVCNVILLMREKKRKPPKIATPFALHKSYKKETGKNAIWHGKHTKSYLDWLVSRNG